VPRPLNKSAGALVVDCRQLAAAGGPAAVDCVQLAAAVAPASLLAGINAFRSPTPFPSMPQHAAAALAVDCVQLAAAVGPASLLAGRTVLSPAHVPVHAAASRGHHSGSKLPTVHGGPVGELAGAAEGVEEGGGGSYEFGDRHGGAMVGGRTPPAQGRPWEAGRKVGGMASNPPKQGYLAPNCRWVVNSWKDSPIEPLTH
jgi:hypothetical protein